MIRCNICNGPLHMNPDGRGATCQDCGIFYPLDALRRMTDAERLRRASVSALYAPPEVMFARHNRPEPPRPAPVYGAPPFGIRRNVRPEPPRPAQSGSLPEHHIRNENRGVSLAERRRSPDYRMPKYDGPVKPSAPGIFASSAARQRYSDAMNEWAAAQVLRRRQLDEYEAQTAEREAYFKRFYEPISPAYSLVEWLPYFEGILLDNFPKYTLRKNVPARELMGGRAGYPRLHFVLERNGRPALAIFLTETKKKTRPTIVRRLEERGIPALCFHTILSNRRDYVIDRIWRALNI